MGYASCDIGLSIAIRDVVDGGTKTGRPTSSQGRRWYLLIHTIPPKPLYLRAKVRNRLARVGAIALKNSVYVLPVTDDCLEDFQWLAQEIVAGGGEAHISDANFVDEKADQRLFERFQAERAADWERLAQELRPLVGRARKRNGKAPPDAEAAAALDRIRKRLSDIARIDFFAAPNRGDVESLLGELERRLSSTPGSRGKGPVENEHLVGRTWVTRKGLHIDRIASAWLIRRFVDPNARFRFIDAGKERPKPDEVGFDMVDGDFTHEGDRCTFETLLIRLRVKDPALRVVAEIVHDIDLKDGKFGRPEAPGIERLLAGMALACPGDDGRVDRGFALFDDLYQSFERGRPNRASEARKKERKGGSR